MHNEIYHFFQPVQLIVKSRGSVVLAAPDRIAGCPVRSSPYQPGIACYGWPPIVLRGVKTVVHLPMCLDVRAPTKTSNTGSRPLLMTGINN